MRFTTPTFVAMLLAVTTAGFSDPGVNTHDNQQFKGTYKIGLEAPLSGDQQTLGLGMLNGAKLAADQINASGGLRKQSRVDLLTL